MLLATGLRYELPSIEGVGEVWARGAYHCPYCHRLGGCGSTARCLRSRRETRLALLLASLSDDVVLLTDGNSGLDPDEVEQLRRAGVVIRDDPVARLEAEGGKLARVTFADGSTDDRTGLFFVPSFTPSSLPAQLGCELDESGEVLVDEDGATSVPGVFAAGDATTDKRKSVVLAAAAGSRAAYSINASIAHGMLPITNRSEASA